MFHAIKSILATCASVLAIGACSSAATIETAAAGPDLRQREEVKSICFQSQIRAWRPNDHHSLIVQMKSNEEYKLQLLGGCNPRDAMLSIGFKNPSGGTCVQAGSEVTLLSGVTPTSAAGPRGGGSCAIEKIYKWERDASSGFGPLDVSLSSAMAPAR